MTLVFMMVLGFAITDVQGQPDVESKPAPALENPVIIMRAQGEGNLIARSWVAPSPGIMHSWISNFGLSSVEIDVYDTNMKTAPPAPCASADITFSAWNETIECGSFEVFEDHEYTWTFTPHGDFGTCAQYFWYFEQALLYPVPSFTIWYTGTVVNVDASLSTDPDGYIVSYGWNWGDGCTSTGVTASHQYVLNGVGHTVTLTVRDNDDLTSSLAKSIPPAPPYFLFGYTNASDGTFLPGTLVTVTNLRTQVSLSDVSDNTSFYMVNIDTMDYGWIFGDVFELSATNGALSGSVQVVLTTLSPPYLQVDIALS